MKAVVWTDYGKIAVRDVPQQRPAAQEVLVRVAAASLCTTDTHMIDQGILGIEPPVIIGHEVAGYVAELGEGVEGLAVGQLVALDPPVPCRQCRVCRAGLTHMCPNTRHIGVHTPGGMAEYIPIDYRNAYAVPPGLSAAAASLAEPFASSLESLVQAGGAAGKTVCVMGDGPFGLIIARLAQLEGAVQVLLFGHHGERMARARADGVHAYDARAVDVERVVMEHTEGYGAEVVVDTTGSPEVLGSALRLLMPRGTLILFAIASGPITFDRESAHLKELSITGACRSLNLFPRALEIMARDAAHTEAMVTQRLPIDAVEEGFALITQRKGSVVKAVMVFE